MKRETVFSWLLLLLGAISFFPQGLYFETAQFWYLFLLTGLFLVYSFVCRKSFLPKTPLDFFVIAVCVVYAVASIRPIYLYNALRETFKYVVYYLTYCMARDLLTDKKPIFMMTTYLSGILMTIATIGTAAGTWSVPSAYNVTQQMLTGVFQYHNATAIFLGCLFLFGLALCANRKSSQWRWIWGSGNALLLFGIWFSYSRGTWILMPFGLLFFYLFFQKRAETLPALIAPVLSVIIVTHGMATALSAQSGFGCWGWTALCILLGGGLSFLLSKCRITKRIGITIGILLLVFLIVLILFAPMILPDNLAQRFSGISLSSDSVLERFTFYQDAASVINDYPLLGVGGGGWPFVYREYQSYDYLSNFPHSFLLQLWTECGILGGIVYLGLLAALIWAMICIWKNRKNSNGWEGTLLSAIFLLSAHSLFDFDLVFMSLSLFFWTMLALIQPSVKKESSVFTWINRVLAVVIFLCSISCITAQYYYSKTADLMEKDLGRAYQSVQTAVRLSPENVIYRITCGDLGLHYAMELQDYSKVSAVLKQTEKVLEEGYKKNPKDHLLIEKLATFYSSCGQPKQAALLVEQLPNLQPLMPEMYEILATVYTSNAQYYQEQNDLAGMRSSLERIVKMRREVQAISNERDIKIRLSDATMAAVGQARQILKQLDGVEGQ